MPVIATHTTDICIRSILQKDSAAEMDPDDILIVDNSKEGWAEERYGLATYRDPDGHNLGCARSWSIGMQRVLDNPKLEYAVFMSASMQFGPIMHTSWTRQMLAFWEERVIQSEGHAWHLIAIHRTVIEKIGLMDSNFYPAYIEAEDYSYRMRQVGWEGDWSVVWINALSQGTALHHPLIKCPADPLLAYRRLKWGGDKMEEQYVLPFGDKPLDYFPEYSIPELAEKYSLGVRGTDWW